MKRILVTLLGIAVLLVIGLAVFVATFDANRYRPEIISLVKQHTGRDLVLGELSLSLWPSLGLDLHEARLGNAPGFGEAPFAEVETVHLSIGLLPLLRRELRVDTIELDGLRLNLARAADGRSNWDDLAGGTDEAEPTPTEAEKAPKPAPDASPSAGSLPVALEIGGLEVRDARIRLRDEAAGTDLRIEPLNLSLGRLSFGTPMPLDLSLRLQQEPGIDLEAKLTGSLTLDPQSQRHLLEKLVLDLVLEDASLPGGRLPVHLEASASADLTADRARLEKLLVQVLGLEANGRAEARNLSGEPDWRASLKLAEFSPRALMQRLGVTPPETGDPQALARAALDLELAVGGDRLRVDPVRIVLDDTTLSGHVALASIARQQVRFDLAVDTIDLDRYLPPPAPQDETAVPQPAATGKAANGDSAPADTPIELPEEALRGLDITGTFRVGRLKAMQAHLSDARIKVSARKGLLEIAPLTAKLYEGDIRAKAALDLRGKQPRYRLDFALSGVQSGPLLKDLYGDEYLTGKADFSLEVTTAGRSTGALERGLNGRLSLAFGEGSVRNAELARKLEQVLALMSGRKADPNVHHTGFSSLTATARIRQGVIDNRDLLLKARKFQVAGLGRVDLPARRIDYELRLSRPGGRSYAPITIRGPLTAPEIRFDQEAWAKQRLERERRKAEEKARKKIEQEIDKRLGDRLKGLFGR